MISDQLFNQCQSNKSSDVIIDTSTEQESKCSRSFKLARRNLASFTLIWYCNTNISLNEKDQQIHVKLRQSINFIVIMNGTEECINFIEKVQDEKIILIVSNATGKEILPIVHDFQQIITIYVYNGCENDESWAKNYNKVKAVITESDELIKKVFEDQIKRDKHEHTLSTTILTPSNLTNGSAKERGHHKLDGNVLWSKLFIEALLRLRNEDIQTSLDELIDLLYEQYNGNDIQCTKIDQFKRSYRPSDAIMWYTKEPFIYQLLNKALRTQDIDTAFAFRFLIRDINEQLNDEQFAYCVRLEQQQRQHLESSLDKILYTYRGQSMSIEEFENFKRSKGQYISINTFFSTSKSKQVGLAFTESNENDNPSQISVLFEVESDIDTPIVTKPFADVHHLSQFDGEEEVLFMIGAVFKITDIYYDDQINNIWIIKLILCDEMGNELNGIFQELRSQILPGKTNVMSIGNILLEMGRFDKAEQYYQRYLKSLSVENIKGITEVYEKLVILADTNGDRHLAEIHWRTVIDMCLKANPNLNSSTVEILYSLNDLYCNRSKPLDFDKIVQVLQQKNLTNLEIIERDHLDTARTYKSISYVLKLQEKFDESLKNCQECLNIQLKLLPENHPELSKTYEAVGDLHFLKSDYDSALTSYEIALKIKSQSLPDNHPEIAQLYSKIGAIYGDYLINYQLALKYYNMALEIYLQTFPSTHINIVELKDIIKKIMTKGNLTNSEQH